MNIQEFNENFEKTVEKLEGFNNILDFFTLDLKEQINLLVYVSNVNLGFEKDQDLKDRISKKFQTLELPENIDEYLNKKEFYMIRDIPEKGAQLSTSRKINKKEAMEALIRLNGMNKNLLNPKLVESLKKYCEKQFQLDLFNLVENNIRKNEEEEKLEKDFIELKDKYKILYKDLSLDYKSLDKILGIETFEIISKKNNNNFRIINK